MKRTEFGMLPDGRRVEAVEIANVNGMRARIFTYGATIQSLTLSDGVDVVLGHNDLDQYLSTPVYVGAAIGRYANRIADAAFTLNGVRYDLVPSNGPNTLHGGTHGFDKTLWSIRAQTPNRIELGYMSPDGEHGFPGALDARVAYELTESNELVVTFTATTDKPTVVAMTQHSYFNLAGEASGSILDHELTIAADATTPVNAHMIPTGEVRRVDGGPFDFREPKSIGARIHAKDEQIALGSGYDHNFVLNKGVTANPEFAARLRDPRSGRTMDILTTEPGLQFYSGNFLTGVTTGKAGTIYGKHAGLCLEPQYFPDSPNQQDFPSTRLDPGQTYRHVSIYRFSG